jgi:hypothetical protein
MDQGSVANFIKNKRQAKKLFAKGMSFSEKKPLIGIILDKELSSKEMDCLESIVKGSNTIDVQVVVLSDYDVVEGRGMVHLPYSRINRKNLLTAADMTLSFSFNDVEEMLLNGAIPISPARPEIKDYNPNKEVGNAFIYKKINKWGMFAALVRARETFKFPYDWNNIVRQGLEKTS